MTRSLRPTRPRGPRPLRPSAALLALAACGPDKLGLDDTADDESWRPRVQLVSPADGETVSGELVWSATATDNGRITSVTFSVGGDEVGQATAEPYLGTWDSSTVANGTWLARVRALDDSGEDDFDEATIYVDNEGGLDPESVAIVSPTEDSTVCGTVPVLVSVSEEVERVVFELNDIERADDDAAPFSWSWDTTSGYDGPHEIAVTAYDAEGRQARASVNVLVDNETEGCDNAPSVAFTSPLSGEGVRGVIELKVNALDDLGVMSVSYYLDSGFVSTLSAAPFSAALDTTGFEDGEHLLSATATDTAGQLGSAEISIIVDNTAPTATFTSPLDGATVRDEALVSVSATDNLGLAELSIYLDDALLASFEEPPYEVLLEATGLGFGEHTLSLLAVDQAGNEATDEITVSVDDAPVVVITEPEGDEIGNVATLAGEATDDEGLRSLAIYVDDLLMESNTGPTVSSTLNTCDDAYGATHTLRISAVDLGDNSAEASRTLTVDRPLEVELSTSAGALDKVATLELLLSDDEAPTSIVFAVDGVTVASSATKTGTEAACFDCGCDLYASSWSTASASEGTHTLSVTVTNSSGDTATDSATITIDYDHDDDGWDDAFYGGEDCDDEDSDHSPLTPEICDGLDQDCDGEIDDGFDVDGDGHLSSDRCPAVAEADDCDDADGEIYTGAVEVCEDDIDNDCDGRDALCPYTGSFVASSYGYRWTGRGTNAYGATGLAAAGDVDGDGLDDVLVGVPYGSGDRTYSGNAYLLLGPATSGGSLSSSTAVEFSGDGYKGYAGARVAAAGDLDADGYADIAVGAYGLSTSASSAGGVDIVSGPLFSDISLSAADVRIVGINADDFAGTGISALGDVNGDGDEDLLVGAIGADGSVGSVGAAYLLLGPLLSDLELDAADATFSGEAYYDEVGSALCCDADLDGDGLNDVAIGSQRSASGAGGVYVFLGPVSAGGAVSAADITLVGASSYAAGSAVSAGDTNGDGYADLLIGAEDYYITGGYVGATFVVHGPVDASASLSAADARIAGVTGWAEFGKAVSAGDLDRDGKDDLLVGEPQTSATSGNGAAYLWYGPVEGSLGTSSADATFSGDSYNKRLGQTAVYAGDLDGDGLGDIVLGAPGAYGTTSANGAAIVLPFAALR